MGQYANFHCCFWKRVDIFALLCDFNVIVYFYYEIFAEFKLEMSFINFDTIWWCCFISVLVDRFLSLVKITLHLAWYVMPSCMSVFGVSRHMWFMDTPSLFIFSSIVCAAHMHGYVSDTPKSVSWDYCNFDFKLKIAGCILVNRGMLDISKTCIFKTE